MPILIAKVNKTVTSIRNSFGYLKINPVRRELQQYIIIGTTTGQLSLYSHSENLDEGLNSSNLTLVWSIIAHSPSKGPYNSRFGSLRNIFISHLLIDK